MRLGVLGPAEGDVAALGRAAEFLLNEARVHRAVYLGDDDALERAVTAWAWKLVGGDASDDAAWARAAAVALEGSAQAIDRFVAGERARLRLKALGALPRSSAAAIERMGSRVAVLVHDRAALTERELSAASVVLFGKSNAPAIEQVGSRWFVTPAALGTSGGGLAVLDDEHQDLQVTIFDGTGNATRRAQLDTTGRR